MKKVAAYMVALAVFLVFGGISQADLNDGLMAYWSFDECSATDETGTGFDGTLFGNPSCEDGVEGKALFIDPVNDYIKFSGALGPNNIRALSFFLNSKGPNDLNRAGYVIGKYNWHGERSFRIESYRGDSSKISVQFYARGDAYDGDGVSSYYEDPGSLDPSKYTIINNAPLETNVWKHVVVNITDTEIEIWIDGSITNKVIRDYQQYFHSGEPVYIGNLFNIGPDFNFNYRLNGTLDEFRVYNRPLTEAEIQQLNQLTLSITTTTVPATKLGELFSFQFEALYGESPYSWSITDGTLPSGMDLSSDGILSGTPEEAGQFTFTVRVTDYTGNFAEKMFILDVLLTLPPPDIRVSKASSLAVPGRKLDYFILVENVGSVMAEDFAVIDFLDKGLSGITANPPPENDPTTDPVIVWNLSSLAPGKATLLSHKSELDPSTPLGEDVGMPVCTAAELVGIAECIQLMPLPVACDVMCGATCGSIPAACLWAFTPVGCGLAIGGCLVCSVGCSLPFANSIMDCIRHFNCKIPENITTGPLDPNEKLVVAEMFIQPDQTLLYPIHFENIGEVEALDVFVTDVLDQNLDVSTLEILTPDGSSFNPATRTVRWDLIGRNLQPGEGDHVLISIKPLPGLPSGTEIHNSALIQFEIFDPFMTNEVVNIIDSTPPVGMMDPLPTETETLNFSISWSGTDAIGEIDTYSVFVSVDGGPFTSFVERTRDISATFTGELGKTYGFICIATDTAGNTEVQNAIAETVTKIIAAGNDPPEAVCQDVTAATDASVCTAAEASVDAGSNDPNGDPITLDQSPSGPYPLGTTEVTLTVTDDKGLSDQCTATVTVVDQETPVIEGLTVSPDTLWPPNHKMVPVTVEVDASDNCDQEPVCQITSVSSNEPVDDLGDGHTAPDWEITGDLTVNLRAERSGNGSRRVYTITVECIDVSGNSSTETVEVTVPHDKSKKKGKK